MEQALKRIQLEGREIVLLGTAHVSKESISDVQQTIRIEEPDCICVELDKARYAGLTSTQHWQELNVAKVIREGKAFLLIANLVLSAFQKRIGDDIGVKPGDEMKAAIDLADELNTKTALVDRPVQTTLKRAWAKNNFWGKAKLLGLLISSMFETEKPDAAEIEALKQQSAMDSMMAEMADYLPTVKEVLIDERDRYLAAKIWEVEGTKTVAVLGAGHLPGTEQHILSFAEKHTSPDVSDLNIIPPPSVAGKIAGMVFPVLIIGLLVAGFFLGGIQYSGAMLVRWIFWNSGLAAVGTVLAGGHIFTVLTAIITAPIGTINPLLSVGFFTGLMQAHIKKPQVRDMENLSSDIIHVRGWYKNKIARVLLVFIISSLGGAAGNIIGAGALIKGLF